MSSLYPEKWTYINVRKAVFVWKGPIVEAIENFMGQTN